MSREINDSYLQAAIKEAIKGVRRNHGGPFGAVIVHAGRIIARGHNQVLRSNDPTAHAEIVAIRKAAAKLGRFDLRDCEIWSTCEPCPMCFAAIHWAKIPLLYYGCTHDDAAGIGFDDAFIYAVIRGETNEHHVQIVQQGRDECLTLFTEWRNKTDRQSY
jgi:guanine deaminase